MKDKLAYVPEKVIEEIADSIIPSLCLNATPQKEPLFILNGGQAGAGKTELNNQAMIKLNNNAVLSNGDHFRLFHPNFKTLIQHPETYIENTKQFTVSFNDKLIKYAEKNRLNLILETTMQNSKLVTETLEYFHKIDYRTILNILAVNHITSSVAIHSRYEMSRINFNNPRYVSQQEHDYRYHKMEVTLKEIENKSTPIDEINIYKRSYIFNQNNVIKSVELRATQPTMLTNTYLEIRNEPLTKTEIKYLDLMLDKTIEAKMNGQSDKKEITHLLELKDFLINEHENLDNKKTNKIGFGL